MHFLGGERDFIKPSNVDQPIEQQVRLGLDQLGKITPVDKIYKLNFFVCSKDSEDYQKIQSYICDQVSNYFSREILLNVIAQAPLTRKVILEVFTYDNNKWDTKMISHESGRAILFQDRETSFLLGTVQANGSRESKEQAEICFSALNDILTGEQYKFGDIVRQWNYIKDIIKFDGTNQNYQDFNDVRSKYYGTAFEKNGYPAATGIGMKEGGVIIEFIAAENGKAVSCPVDNPEQIAAHHYSQQVLIGKACDKTTPKFERARYLAYQKNKMMFISGTASIKGEHTIGVDDPIEQTKVTIDNIKRLYSDAVLEQNNIKTELVFFNHCRVYIKNKDDFEVIENTCKQLYGSIPMVFIQANICRDNLLVEIEGEVIL